MTAEEILLQHAEDTEVLRILLADLVSGLHEAYFSVEAFVAVGKPYLDGFVALVLDDLVTFLGDEVLAGAQAYLTEIDLLGGALSAADRAALLNEALGRVAAGVDDFTSAVWGDFAAYVKTLQRAGMTKSDILAALTTAPGKLNQALGPWKTGLADMARQFVSVIDDVSYQAATQRRAAGAAIRMHVWVTRFDRKVCGRGQLGAGAVRVSCWHRHGRAKTYNEWIRLGLPGSGSTLCGRRCRCVLFPQAQLAAGVPRNPLDAGEAIARAKASAAKRLDAVERYRRGAGAKYRNLSGEGNVSRELGRARQRFERG